MEPLNSDPNPYRPPDGSLATEPVDVVPSGSVFSWTRALELLACLLSATWIVMPYMTDAGFRLTRDDMITLAVVTAAAMVPILLFLRGRWLYFLGVPVLLLAALSIYDLLSALGRARPGEGLP
jgi:hypothetical protein